MNSYKPDFYIRLELDSTATEKDVKRAYAKRLKSIDQATQASEFLQLREDYESALHYANLNIQSQNLTLNESETTTLYSSDEYENNQASDKLEDYSVKKDWISTEIELDLYTFKPEPFSNEYFVEPSHVLMQSVITEIQEEINKSRFINVHFVVELLRQRLEHDDFLHLESKDALEKFLIKNLFQRIFGINNLIVLLGVKKVFNWDRDWRYKDADYANLYVDEMLFHLANHYDLVINNFSFIAKEPKVKDSKMALEAYHSIKKISSKFADFCVPAEHLQEWENCFNKKNLFGAFQFRFREEKLFSDMSLINLVGKSWILRFLIMISILKLLRTAFELLFS